MQALERWRWAFDISAAQPRAHLFRSNLTIKSFRLRKVTVYIFTVKATNKRNRSMLEDETDAVIAYANPVILSLGVKALEVGDLLEGSDGFNLFDDFLDSPEQRRVGNGRQVRVEGFAKRRVHAARSNRWKIFFLLVSRDFSPA